MMKFFSLLCSLAAVVVLSLSTQATTIVEEIDRVAGEVAKLQLGFGKYTLGSSLTTDQQNAAQAQLIPKSLEGTYKFKDGDIFVVASKKDNMVLGVYKEFPDSTVAQLKNIIGSLMMEHGEPTAMAHEKMIYWTYGADGKIEQDVFEFERDSGGAQFLAAVKFSSSERIAPGGEEGEENKKISAYVMITSDPLSKLFLAHNRAEIK